MRYLITGTFITLISIGLMRSSDSLVGFLGIIVLIIGIAIALKGRRELDKFKLGKR